MKNIIIKIIDGILNLFPYTNKLVASKKQLAQYKKGFVPGHYYSPIPDLEIIERDKDIIFNKSKKEVPGIDLRDKEQKELLEKISTYYNEVPFPENQIEDFRYYFSNMIFAYSDAIILYGIINEFKPKRIIEIGSGFSSAAILDTNEHCFNDSIQCTFIEPYPDRLKSLLKQEDLNNESVILIEDFVQKIPYEKFLKLKENDVLFIDSSHVAKIGSDVCYLFFEIIPRLNKGVIIHIHDVFNNFEYPQEWVFKGRAWNESYFLRSFLQFNNSFEILLFSSYLEDHNEAWFKQNMPKCLQLHEKGIIDGKETYSMNRGQSIWIKKIN